MQEQGLEALLVSNTCNCRYLSGFSGSDVSLLITHDFNGIAVDPRFVVQAQQECPDWDLLRISGDMAEWFLPIASQSETSEWGIESDSLSLLSYQRMTEAISLDKQTIRLIPVSGLIQKMRVLKQPEEITAIEKACHIVDESLSEAVKVMHADMTEKHLAWLLESILHERGSNGVPFEIIVASGPNAAMPHASPTDRVIKNGEPVVIDCGAKSDGYCSDITRTYCFGQPDQKFRSVYTAVLGSQLTTLSTLKPGMAGRDADQLARSVLKECGYEEYFQHGLGHGVGLEIHEMPRVGSKSDDPLQIGTVFTVEPGVYLPGWGGIRIEDTVVMEENGVRLLTKSGKDAVIIK
jgi:Xaa-Pro aminopeptidase